MKLLPKLRALMRRCTMLQTRCETRLQQKEQQLVSVDNDLVGLDSQESAMKQLMKTQQPRDSVLNRAELFDFLRRQAVLRRQLQQLDLSRTELLEQRELILKEKEEARVERAFWMRKQDKYARWSALQRRQQRLTQLLREESETQESTTWHR